MNKLPKNLTKKYTERQFNRKILKKIFIKEDKKFIKSIFVKEKSDNPKKPGKYYIPEDIKLSKNDFRKLSAIGKQIKKQKGRIKLLPLIASLSFLFLFISFFLAAKDIYIKNKIVSYFQYTFEAKCDIEKVSLKIFDSSFTVKGFEIADKDSPMRNVFSFDSLVIDFDLIQLLRGRIVAEELSITGMNSGTARKYDGSLSPKKLKKIRADKAKKAKEAEEKKQQIITALGNATEKVKNNVADEIVRIFNTFNPEIILESCYSQLETPEMAKVIQDEATLFINKWKDTPEKINTQLENIKGSAEAIINFDYNSILNDPKKIKEMLNNFDLAANSLNEVKAETDTIVSYIQEDVNTIQDLSVGIQNSINHDIGVGKDKIEELKSFKLPSGQEFLASTIDIYGYELLGKYYPKAKELINYLINMKGKQAPKKEKVEKNDKYTVKRAPGRDITFVYDYTPKFWIKKIKVSGFNMDFTITNITNNMDKINRPTEAIFTLKNNDILHGGKVVVDIRTNTEKPLVYLEYTCDGTSFAHEDGIPGVPQINTKANYFCSAEIYEEKPFVMNGKGQFYDLKLTTPYFEPAYVHDIYNSILGRFDSAEVGLELLVESFANVSLKAETDIDEKISEALKDEINYRLTEIKKAIEIELAAKIDEYKQKAMVLVDKFYEIKDQVFSLENQIKELESKLLAKKEEFENKVTAFQNQVEDKIQENTEKVEQKITETSEKIQDGIEEKSQEVKNQMEEEAEKIENKIKEDMENAASSAIKGMLGGLKK